MKVARDEAAAAAQEAVAAEAAAKAEAEFRRTRMLERARKKRKRGEGQEEEEAEELEEELRRARGATSAGRGAQQRLKDGGEEAVDGVEGVVEDGQQQAAPKKLRRRAQQEQQQQHKEGKQGVCGEQDKVDEPLQHINFWQEEETRAAHPDKEVCTRLKSGCRPLSALLSSRACGC